MTLSPDLSCKVCGAETTFAHDHQSDNSGLDDGPLIRAPRKQPTPKSRDEYRAIRARAWATRRQKYGASGHD